MVFVFLVLLKTENIKNVPSFLPCVRKKGVAFASNAFHDALFICKRIILQSRFRLQQQQSHRRLE